MERLVQNDVTFYAKQNFEQLKCLLGDVYVATQNG